MEQDIPLDWPCPDAQFHFLLMAGNHLVQIINIGFYLRLPIRCVNLSLCRTNSNHLSLRCFHQMVIIVLASANVKLMTLYTCYGATRTTPHRGH